MNGPGSGLMLGSTRLLTKSTSSMRSASLGLLATLAGGMCLPLTSRATAVHISSLDALAMASASSLKRRLTSPRGALPPWQPPQYLERTTTLVLLAGAAAGAAAATGAACAICNCGSGAGAAGSAAMAWNAATEDTAIAVSARVLISTVKHGPHLVRARRTRYSFASFIA